MHITPPIRQITIERTSEAQPLIDLAGAWMAAAGFHPGQTVDLTAVSPGVIEMRVSSPVQLSADTFRVMGVLDHAIQTTDNKKTNI